MGLYDYIRCKYPLPIKGANSLLYQTKDTTAQYMDLYEIREDGTLWHENYDTEDRSDPKAEGIFKLRGCISPVNKRWEQVIFTGEIRFYTSLTERKFDRDDAGWIEFSAYYVDGILNQINLIKYRKPMVMALIQQKLSNLLLFI